MKSLIYFACLVFIVVSRDFQESQALECYACEGPKNTTSACELNVTSSQTEECQPGFVCATVVFKDLSNNQSTIRRLCEEPNKCEIYDRLSNNSHAMSTVTYCSTCNSTLCNLGSSANSFVLNSGWISVVFGVVFIFLNNLAY